MPLRDPHPIVIIGAGPVGLTLAACLAAIGTPSLVIERRTGPSDGSRAICLSRRTLEIFEWAGCAAPVAAAALGWRQGRTYFGDREVHRLEMDHDPDQRWLPMYNLQQNRLEELLDAHCRATGLVEIRRGAVRGIAALDDHVAIDCADGPPLAAHWAVACDGARSTVRSLMGLQLQGRSYAGRYLIADIHLPSAYPVERRMWFAPPGHPRSSVIMHRQPDDIWRIDYQLVDGESDAEALEPARLRRRISDHLDFIGETAPWTLTWSSIYRAHTLALERYRHGRVLFAGDAAHLVPIFGVRGLNSGIADAHNLAWKLARVAAGAAPDALLDSYSSERRGATGEIFQQSARTTRFVTPSTRGDVLMRDAVLSLAVRHDFVRGLIDPRQSTANDYFGSPLNSVASLAAGPQPGAAMREMRLADGWLHDRLGRDFALVSPDPEIVARAEGAGLNAVPVPPTPYLAPGASYLVRPDGHVAACWSGDPGDAVAPAITRAMAA